MTVHTIPADHLDAARGGVLVVYGFDLLCDACGSSASIPLEMECYQHNPRRQPPAWALALLEPCEQCNGTGERYAMLDPTDDCNHFPCFDCGGPGRPWLNVDVLEYGGMSDDGPGPWKTDSFRAHVLDVVPIGSEYLWFDDCQYDGGQWLYQPDGPEGDAAVITLPPGDHVGRYAVLIEPETS